jgi:hypothetical protein
LTATGPTRALAELANHLRAPLEVWDPVAGAVWWGYVNRVELQREGIRIGVSLDAMANRVAVAFTRSNPGSSGAGEHAMTAWAEDAGSIATYGAKELVRALAEASDAQASQLRDNLLESNRYPLASVRRTPHAIPGTAELGASGWWATLGWKYYSQTADRLEGGAGVSDAEVHLGDNNESIPKSAVAQKFQFTGGSQRLAETISVWVDKSTRSVAQLLTVALCAYDTAGAPGAVLASATRASGDVVWGDWNEFVLNTRVALTDAAWYWVKVSVASVGATWYNLHGKSGGAVVLRVQNASTGLWSNASPACELKYRIGCVRENTDQIRTAIEASGQFIAGVDVDQVSGLYSNIYRDGLATGLQVVEDLLAEGTTNDLSLLAEVGQRRRVRIYERPARPGAPGSNLILDSAGRLYDEWGNPWNPHVSPVGRWCFVRDAALPALDTTRLANPGVLFVERAVYEGGLIVS